MSNQEQNDSVAVIPSTLGANSSPAITDTSSATTVNHHFGTITRTIGTGQNAKDSIVWMTITWSFYIATGITVIFCIFLAIVYYQNKETLILELMKHMFSVWSIFTPLITLSLGYAFGRNETN